MQHGQVSRLARQVLPKAIAQRLRNRLPDWTLAQLRRVFEHVVKHGMRLQAKGGPVRRVECLFRMTTNLTSFFREEHHFPILAAHALAGNAPLKVWCNASSTGEEPYSIAITLCEAFDTLRPPVSILATDIDTRVLEEASDGVYSMDRVSELSQERRKRFFLRGKGEQSGKVRIRPELRALIEFQPLNLLDSKWSVKGPLDAIFCRNVMIYFDKPTQKRILERFVPLMKPNALLFSGHSENVGFVTDSFKLQRKTVYQLQADASQRGRALVC